MEPTNNGITIKFKQLTPNSYMPARKSEGAAGFDLAVNAESVLPAGKVTVLHTGYAVEIPPGYEGQVRMRSSWGKRGVICPNAPGTVDWDYRGEVMVLALNLSGEDITLPAGERIAQLVIAPIANVSEVKVVSELSDTVRGSGGFGSTGRRIDGSESEFPEHLKAKYGIDRATRFNKNFVLSMAGRDTMGVQEYAQMCDVIRFACNSQIEVLLPEEYDRLFITPNVRVK
jgi:dUTP pyrophosphatase